MPVPITYRKSPEGVTANYDFIDLLSKTGSVRYYTCTSTLTGSTIYYFLSTQAVDASLQGYDNGTDPRITSAIKGTGVTSSTAAKSIDVDIDSSEITSPIILQGDFIASVAFGVGLTDSATYADVWVNVILKKLATDGATETTLLTLNSNVINTDSGASNSTYSDKYFTMKGDVPKTAFKIGEKIRITVELYATGTGGKTVSPVIYVDPNNAAITLGSPYVAQSAGYTSTEFIIPFRIDL